MRTAMMDVHIWKENLVDFLMDADEILGFDYSCLIIFGMLASLPIAVIALRRVWNRNSQMA